MLRISYKECRCQLAREVNDGARRFIIARIELSS